MKINNFKKVESDYEAPDSIRKEVSSSLGFFRNAGRIFDLYLGKIAWIFAGLLRGHHIDEDPKNDDPASFGENDTPDHQMDHDANNNRGF